MPAQSEVGRWMTKIERAENLLPSPAGTGLFSATEPLRDSLGCDCCSFKFGSPVVSSDESN